MRGLLAAAAVLALFAVGVLAVVLGGADDSPGLQGIGALFVIAAVVLGVRAFRRGRAETTPGR
jgi:peptidoglycan/LPS O-acetylase OafA/YrhL